MMGFPLFKDHAVMFLSGSNAARAYKLVQEILPPPAGAAPAAPGDIYDTHMATLSDNDFMFYLLNENSEPYRLAIRMMLGACLYYLKYILNPRERETFTNVLEESISIVGHNDHLLAQRLNANEVFLRRCFDMPLLLNRCNITDFDANTFYQQLSGNVTLAFLDVVFKHNTAEYWYDSVFSIFGIDIPPGSRNEVLHFLTTDAMAVNCIATPWTLILNILYTIFVTENCVARIVVGKLGNDPKNLEKYFSILDTHLGYLEEYYTTSIRETEERETKDRNEDRETEISRDRERDREKSTGRGRGRSRSRIRDSKKQMLDEIIKTLSLQQDISKKSKIFQTNQITENYDELKTSCGLWVQKMVTLACDKYTRELFFLSVEYPFITRARAPTPLETGISCAWSEEGNICNKEEFLAKYAPAAFDATTVVAHRTDSEQKMHIIVPRLQNLINTAVITAQKFNVTPIPPIDQHDPVWTHYEYMDYLWKHLTKTSINLRSNFKSIVKDLTQIVGSKYFTAISLLGAYPCGLLIDELEEKENTNRTPGELTVLKNSGEILNCRQGLLPLLVPEDVPDDLTRSTLFATMVVELLYLEFYPFPFAPAPPPRAAADNIYSTNNILIFLGFLFSIKIKSNASVGPRNMLSLVDSITNFHNIPDPGLLHVASGGMPKKKSETAKASKASKTSAEPVTPPPSSAGPVTSWVPLATPVLPLLKQESLSAPQNPWNPSSGLVTSLAPTASAKAKASVKPPAAPKKESVKASASTKPPAAPIKASEATATGVAKVSAKKLKTTLDTTKKVETDVDNKLLKAQNAVKHKEEKEKTVARNQLLNPSKQLLNPSTGSFKNFMDKLRIVALTKGINFVPNTKVTGVGKIEEVREKTYRIARKYNSNATLNPYYEMYTHLGGGSNRNNNKTKSMNKLSKKNNHTRRNNNKRKNKSFPNHRKVIPYSRSGSQSNRKKSKAKLSRKNVTFKRRRARK
jgi:hypothetical protein